MPELHRMYFSQHALEIYRRCPLRFRRRYLEGLYWSPLWSAPAAEREVVEKGEIFHLLARRYYSGLVAVPPAGHPWEPDLRAWLEELKRFLPRRDGCAYYPELELRLSQPGLRLMARLDLLVVAPDGTATVYDWKTERRLPRRSYLAHSLQTLVYRYLVCAAGGAYSPHGAFAPHQVTLVYWNPHEPGAPEAFPYSQSQFERDERQIRSLVAQILATPYPDGFRATTDERTCRTCEYRPLCHGRRWDAGDAEQDEDLDAELAWDAVPEVPI